MGSGWMIREKLHAGEEHLDRDEAARFDDKLPFDPSTEVQIFREKGLSDEETVVDFGTGTGVFPLAIADHCQRVVAVDISDAMLAVLEERIEDAEVSNIELVNAGFVSYDHRGEAASFAFSKDALHHLPDFWKGEALKNVGRTLKNGGIFRLRDFVFSFDPRESRDEIDAWIAENTASTPFTAEEIHRHFRDEFSTYGFVLEQILDRVGFEILDAHYPGKFYAEYTCRWHAPSA